MGGSEAQIILRLRFAVRRLAEARWNAQARGLLSDELSRLAVDSVLQWAQGSSERQWMGVHGISSYDRDLLRSVGAWPWGNDTRLDAALEDAHVESVGIATQS